MILFFYWVLSDDGFIVVFELVETCGVTSICSIASFLEAFRFCELERDTKMRADLL